MHFVLIYALLSTVTARSVRPFNHGMQKHGIQKRAWGGFPTRLCDWVPWAGNQAPGAGFEMETRALNFESQQCKSRPVAASDKLKGKVVGDRQDHAYNLWRLTAEITHEAGRLMAEWIIDGLLCKIHLDSAIDAARELYEDMTSWDPLGASLGHTVSVDTSECTDWEITAPDGGQTPDLKIYTHVTAPLALASIHDLILLATTGREFASVLLPRIPGENLIAVTHDFFKAFPLGIDGNAVSDDGLGFLSVLLSICKFAGRLEEGQSPKHLNSLMPRTDLTVIWNHVKPGIANGFVLYGNPALPGSLFYLMRLLACWQTGSDGYTAEPDHEFCDHANPDQPVPNNEMYYISFTGRDEDDEDAELSMETLVNGIQNGQIPSPLTVHDQQWESQYGALDTRMEYVMLTDILVPIWELRDLMNIYASNIEAYVHQCLSQVRIYHRNYALSQYPQLHDIFDQQTG